MDVEQKRRSRLTGQEEEDRRLFCLLLVLYIPRGLSVLSILFFILLHQEAMGCLSSFDVTPTTNTSTSNYIYAAVVVVEEAAQPPDSNSPERKEGTSTIRRNTSTMRQLLERKRERKGFWCPFALGNRPSSPGKPCCHAEGFPKRNGTRR